MFKFFEKIGISIKNWIFIARDALSLTGHTLFWIFLGPSKGKKINVATVFDQMVFMGVNSIVIVFFVTLFTGIVLAMQSAYQLEKMGAVFYVSSLVSISVCRELGPVLTALVIAGRIGAAITAEIGSMKVNEQLEALDTMAISPVRFLVAPKLIALFFMLPCLTVVGDLSGMAGGYLVGVYNLDISPALYLKTTWEFLTLKDVYTGLFKSFIFAIVIAMVGCYQGMKTEGGAVGVGRSTTTSVVTSFILVIIADCIMTGIFYFSNM